MSHVELGVEVDETLVGDGDSMKSDINVVVVTRWGSFSNYFPRSIKPEEIAQALRHKAMFLEDDLSIMMEPDQRNGILEAFRKAADLVPGLKK